MNYKKAPLVGATYVVRTYTDKRISHTIYPTKHDARKAIAKILMRARVSTVCTLLQTIEYVSVER